MSSTITCRQCGELIEISQALQGQIEQQILAAEHERHATELSAALQAKDDEAKRERQAVEALMTKQLDGERAMLRRSSEADLELEKQRLASEAETAHKKAVAEQALLVRKLHDTAEQDKASRIELEASNKQMRGQLAELMQTVRSEKQARENAELEAARKLHAEEGKIREEATKTADERQRLNLAAKEKTITDLQKALDDAQRKAAQGSQQLQGEVMELDLEQALADTFRDDLISPIAKGVNGADISQIVRTSRGTDCGIILWEIKRTKNWTDGWIPKLKTDLRAAKANIPVIITQAMPKQLDGDIGQLEGVWICKQPLALMLATLLRRPLLEVTAQKALAENRGSKAESLFNYVTSHEFVQQIESMVETYQEMTLQVQKERVVYEKLWAQREKQAQKLFMGTANIVGGMQGHIGQAAMPRIKGLELDSGLDDNEDNKLFA